MKRFFVGALLAFTIASLSAQSPKGWKMRVDRSTAASDPDAPGDIKFVTSGKGFHAAPEPWHTRQRDRQRARLFFYGSGSPAAVGRT